MHEVNGVALPKQYGPWSLQTHDIEFDPESGDPTHGVIQYEAVVSEGVTFSVYIERENDGSWGGALLDSGEPENPHRDAISTFYGDDIPAVLGEAKTLMDKQLDRYMR